SGHPMASRIARAARAAIPNAWIIYGGVFPTYHWSHIIEQEPAIYFLVRREGEETILRLIQALGEKQDLEQVPGIVFRAGVKPGPRPAVPLSPSDGERVGVRGSIRATRPASVIANLDANRIGWELIDHRRY